MRGNLAHAEHIGVLYSIYVIQIKSGVEGFEPPNSGTKTRCLTTWPHPNFLFIHYITKKRKKIQEINGFKDNVKVKEKFDFYI